MIEYPRQMAQHLRGHINKGENIEDGAYREFLEETGYSCSNLDKLGEFYETYGQLNRKIHIYYSNNVQKIDINNQSSDEVKEDIEVILVDYNKAVEMALDNKIAAMGSSLAVLLLKAKLES